MKICLFSDLHGNNRAFEAALPLLLAEKADRYFFLGDICGYYFETIKIWHMLKQIPSLTCIRGNHDDLFLNFYADKNVPASYTTKYGFSLSLLVTDNTPEILIFADWLKKLDCVYFDKIHMLKCIHAYPDGKHEYLYPDTSAYLSNTSGKYVFFGHTHYAMCKRYAQTLFINPGSLGQPRDGKPPCFMTIVLPENEFHTHYVQYDVRAFIKDLSDMKNIPPYLINILKRSL